MTNYKDKIAVVTGAGSGIGKELALALAQKGCRLSISDINSETLSETVKAIEEIGVEVIAKTFDVSQRKEAFAFAAETINRYGGADIVINNAGKALDSIHVSKMDIEDFEYIMGINFWGVVYGTKAFLPYLKRSKEGALVNISSVFGIYGIAGQSAYCTSKFAVRGFTETLRMELYVEAPQLTTICVHPGGIKTNIARNSKEAINDDRSKDDNELRMKEFEDKFLVMPPSRAAEIIIDGITRKKERVLIGRDARRSDLLARIWPSKYSRMILRSLEKAGILNE